MIGSTTKNVVVTLQGTIETIGVAARKPAQSLRAEVVLMQCQGTVRPETVDSLSLPSTRPMQVRDLPEEGLECRREVCIATLQSAMRLRGQILRESNWPKEGVEVL